MLGDRRAPEFAAAQSFGLPLASGADLFKAELMRADSTAGELPR
ncbi:hypothetical protein [Chelatococcus asaccharovorans]|nr:hypothetical protein [Chelatococcus asaccharovorans]